jgi:threonine dehydratase
VSERAIADAMRVAHRELAIDLEGSAAVALAWALANDVEPPTVAILTGRNVDPEVLARVLCSD